MPAANAEKVGFGSGNGNSLYLFCVPIYISTDRSWGLVGGVWCEVGVVLSRNRTIVVVLSLAPAWRENSEAAGLVSVENQGRSTICWVKEHSILLPI